MIVIRVMIVIILLILGAWNWNSRSNWVRDKMEEFKRDQR